MEVAGIRSAAELGLAAPGRAVQGDEEELGKNQFLELMIAQLEHQDPLEPAKNEDFIAQLAQFSSVEGIANLNDSVNGMASAIQSSLSLQAASLVGRDVLAATDSGVFDGENLDGNVNLPSAVGGLQIDITSPDGSLVRQLNLGAQATGLAEFSWDGLNEAGETQRAGIYSVNAYSFVDGEQVAQTVNLPNRVVGVTLGDRGVVANLAGGAQVSTLDIKEIR